MTFVRITCVTAGNLTLLRTLLPGSSGNTQGSIKASLGFLDSLGVMREEMRLTYRAIQTQVQILAQQLSCNEVSGKSDQNSLHLLLLLPSPPPTSHPNKKRKKKRIKSRTHDSGLARRPDSAAAGYGLKTSYLQHLHSQGVLWQSLDSVAMCYF